MIDIESKVVDTLANALSNTYVTTSYELTPEDLPALCVQYTYSGDYTRSFDEQLSPHHARILVQLDTYATERSQAKAIASQAVNVMHSMKFTCTELRDLSSYYNGLSRVTSRFSAVVQEAQDINGNTVYQMYRN